MEVCGLFVMYFSFHYLALWIMSAIRALLTSGDNGVVIDITARGGSLEELRTWRALRNRFLDT